MTSPTVFFGGTFSVRTGGRGLHEITSRVQDVVSGSRVQRGLCTVFLHHTSASLIITENADQDVASDLEAFLSRLVVDGDRLFKHRSEGPDDMSAHVRTALTQTTLGIPVAGGRCDLGTWQGIFLWEHRHRHHDRRVSVAIVGELAG
ncbi:MAG: YjbQ family protein [Candidatus Schekmanbacteria bacterium]|nr:YjbQ family protein [Candidatus Schekmanbacteria bacterium]